LLELKKKHVEAAYEFKTQNPEIVKLPEKNGGKTYLYSWTQEAAKNVKIAPIIDGTQCEISDTVNELDDCSTLSG